MGGPVPSATIDLPSSYTSLNTTQITLSHVPASSPTPTPVVLVTLNRPKNYNAFTKVMEEELVRVFEMFDLDDRVRCVVLNGAGKMFCAGADLDIGFKPQKEKELGVEHRDGFVTLTPLIKPSMLRMCLQWRKSLTSNTQLFKTNHRSDQRISGRCRNNHDTTSLHPRRLRISKDWLCVRQARNHHGSLLFVLSAPLDRHVPCNASHHHRLGLSG